MDPLQNLSTEQKSLLYAALLFYKSHAEEAHAEVIINDRSPIAKKFFALVEQTVKELMQELFGETHIDELDFTRSFNQRLKESLQSNYTGEVKQTMMDAINKLHNSPHNIL